ncbi:CoA transferase subunit A [Aerococcaceae bacterium DSM 111022]|nr:CoA transferase subunit A [Aerococcaceae bacterium DSM 111022]
MKNKVSTIAQVLEKLKDEQSMFVGGFMANGGPNRIMEAISKTDLNNLDVIAGDAAFPNVGVGKIIDKKQVRSLKTSHIGLNREAGRQMIAGEMEIELIPQGTLIERIRSAGYGLGGVLTPTGLGTEVAKGKDIVEVDGKEYLLEKPLHADVAILYATKADKKGNLYFRGSTQNYNNAMATAADLVIVEAEEIVEVGEIPQEAVHVPGIFIDMIVDGGAL